MPEVSAPEWDDFLSCFPDAHVLQTTAWGELKTAFGWQPVRLISHHPQGGRIGAQVLFRPLPFGLSLAYLPKGPIGEGQPDLGSSFWSPLWHEVDELCRARRAIFLKVEPDIWERPDQNLDRRAAPAGFRLGRQDIQPPRTLLVDLTGDEEAVLARMKQKTRYNIRLALKKGVLVSPSADFIAFHRLLMQTGQREDFGVHSLEYYRRAYELFYPRAECELFLAEFEGQPLAGLMVFARGSRAWYFYGASSEAHREKMPSYLLQWEAMRWARAHGCSTYDLWGVPDVDEQTLEAHFTSRSDGLWGVYRFKRGFGGQLRRAQGPWDRVYNPWLYALYCRWIAFRRPQE